jgi:hypothetical protein
MADCRSSIVTRNVAYEAGAAEADDLFAALQQAERQQRQVAPLRRDERHLLHPEVLRHIHQHHIRLLGGQALVQSRDADLGHHLGYGLH